MCTTCACACVRNNIETKTEAGAVRFRMRGKPMMIGIISRCVRTTVSNYYFLFYGSEHTVYSNNYWYKTQPHPGSKDPFNIISD